MVQVWFFICSMIFHYGKKLWRAEKEVQILVGLIVSLMALSIALKILLSPLQLIELIKIQTEEETSPLSPMKIEEKPIQIELPLQIDLPSPPTEEEEEPQITVVEPKLQVTIEQKPVEIDEAPIEIEDSQAQYMKLCLKDKKVKSKDPKSDPVKTIKMTLCDGKGNTLFEESTNFQVFESDGVLPTLIVKTAPIPIDNY